MNQKRNFSRIDLRTAFFLCLLCFGLASCYPSHHSPSEVLNQTHISKLSNAPEKTQKSLKSSFKKTNKLSNPLPPNFKKIVSVIITEEVPLKDAFVELAQQAKIDLQLDSKVSERIIFSANKRPFIEIINDICTQAGLRY